MLDERIVILGVIINLIGTTSYLIDTIKGKTKPNRVTWALWAMAPLIAFTAQISQGVGWAALITFVTGFSPLLIFLASFLNRKSSWKLTRFDLVCGALSIGGLILWQLTGDAILAIVFAIMADFLAGVPTLVKAFKEPETENWHAFFFAGISTLITLLVIDSWQFMYYGFALYITVFTFSMAALIKFKLGPKIMLRVNKKPESQSTPIN